MKILNIYITKRIRKSDNKPFSVYKTRNIDGKWAQVKFTMDAGQPKPFFTLGEHAEKGYVSIQILRGNINDNYEGIEENEEPRKEFWVQEFKIAEESEQLKFKKHIEKIKKDYEDKKVAEFNSFFEDSIKTAPAEQINTEDLPF